MEKWQKLEGKAAALMHKNIDTDIITPMRHIVSMAREDMHKIAFDPLRFREDGSENPEFVLNRNAFRGAPILIAGANFGCGSSRETAVWAIKGLGIRCVIAESFGDIFHNNCFQNAILPIRLPADEMERMAAEAENPEASARFTIDLQACEITTPTGRIVTFTVDPDRREALLEGLDDIARTLRLEDEIAAFQEADRAAHPWIYDTAR